MQLESMLVLSLLASACLLYVSSFASKDLDHSISASFYIFLRDGGLVYLAMLTYMAPRYAQFMSIKTTYVLINHGIVPTNNSRSPLIRPWQSSSHGVVFTYLERRSFGAYIHK